MSCLFVWVMHGAWVLLIEWWFLVLIYVWQWLWVYGDWLVVDCGLLLWFLLILVDLCVVCGWLC